MPNSPVAPDFLQPLNRQPIEPLLQIEIVHTEQNQNHNFSSINTKIQDKRLESEDSYSCSQKVKPYDEQHQICNFNAKNQQKPRQKSEKTKRFDSLRGRLLSYTWRPHPGGR